MLNFVYLFNFIFASDFKLTSSSDHFLIPVQCETSLDNMHFAEQTLNQVREFLYENGISPLNASNRLELVKRKLEDLGYSKENTNRFLSIVKNRKVTIFESLSYFGDLSLQSAVREVLSIKSKTQEIDNKKILINDNFLVVFNIYSTGLSSPKSHIYVCHLNRNICSRINEEYFQSTVNFVNINSVQLDGSKLKVILNARMFPYATYIKVDIELEDYFYYKVFKPELSHEVTDKFDLTSFFYPTNSYFSIQSSVLYNGSKNESALKLVKFTKEKIDIFELFINSKIYKNIFINNNLIDKHYFIVEHKTENKYIIYELNLLEVFKNKEYAIKKFKVKKSNSENFRRYTTPFKHDSRISKLVVSEDGKNIVSVSEKSEIIVSFVDDRKITGYKKINFGNRGEVELVDFVNSSSKLIIVYKSGRIVVIKENFENIIYDFNFFEFLLNESTFESDFINFNSKINKVYFSERYKKLVVALSIYSKKNEVLSIESINFYTVNLEKLNR